jgi:hypothetical protein
MRFDEGLYRGKAVAWGLTETANGHDQFWMSFRILGKVVEHKLDAELTPCAGGVRRWSIMLSDKTVEWLVSTVQHLGYSGDDLLGLDPERPGAFNFEGVDLLVQ